MSKVKMGVRARDIITGFEGIVTATSSYITGCDQCSLTPDSLDKDGKVQSNEWFDINRLMYIEDGVNLPNTTEVIGGPQQNISSKG